VVVIDHDIIRRNYAAFRKNLPRVQAYYAVKANPAPEIVRTLYRAGASFDVASMPEFMLVYENIQHLDARAQQDFIWDKIVYANPIKPKETLEALNQYKPLVTFDNPSELDKIKQHAPDAGLILRLRVPNTGSMVELSSKFGCDPGDAVGLIEAAFGMGLVVEGVSFHVGSQCTRVENYIEALEIASIIARDARLKQLPFEIVDIGGGFPIRHFDHEEDPFDRLAPVLAKEIDRLFDRGVRVMAEPGRLIVGPAATLVMRVIGKAIRENKLWYYLDDGLYGSLSGQVFDHCKYQFKFLRGGHTGLSTLAGPTCDSFDIIARGEEIPELQLGDLVYVENIGAYSVASATTFNGMPLAKVLMIS